MSEQLRWALVGVSDGRELEAALAAEGVSVAGFWGEDEVAMAELAAYYGVPAASDWRSLLEADALLLGEGLPVSANALVELVMADKPLLLTPALLARPDAIDWLATLADGSAPVGLALSAAVDDGLAYCRNLVRGGVLGDLLGVEVRVAAGDDAWALLAEQLGAALWVLDQTPVALNALRKASAGALYVSALIETTAGTPLSVALRAAVPGGAHDDLQAPRILGERGQLILTPEPLGWFASASESNRSQQWDKLVYAGGRGSLARCLTATSAALRADAPPPTPLAAALDLARVLAALRGVDPDGYWSAAQ